MILLAHNLDNIGKAAVIAGAALAIPFAKIGLGLAIAAVKALSVAIATNPIGAIAIAIVTAVTALIQFSDQISFATTSVTTLTDVFAVLWEMINVGVDLAIGYLRDLGDVGFAIASTLFDALPESIRNVEVTFIGLLRFVAKTMDGFVGLLRGGFNVLTLLLTDSFEEMDNNVRRIFGGMVNAIIEQINTAIKQVNFIRDLLNEDPIKLVDLIEVPDKRDESIFNDFGKNAGNAFSEGYASSTIATDLLTKTLKAGETLFDDFNARVRKKTIDRLVDERRDQDRARRSVVSLDEKPAVTGGIPFALQAQLDKLAEETRILSLSNGERDRQNKLMRVEATLRASNVSLAEGSTHRQLLIDAIDLNVTLAEQVAIVKSIRGPQDALIERSNGLADAFANEAINVAELAREMQSLAFAQAQLNIDQGQGTFVDGFLIGMEQMLETVRNFESEAGTIFADFFTNVAQGFSDSLANAIVFGDDLKESLGNAAREVLASLLSGLINIGAQFVLNKAFQQTAAGAQLGSIGLISTAQNTAAATAAATSAAVVASTTAAVVASNVAILASATPAATMVSLASYGANAIPAQTGIIATAAVAKAAALPGFKDGGFIRGGGGPRSDSITANLSNGEFVVNAKSTARFRPQLEAMNSKGFRDGGFVHEGSDSSVPAAPSAAQLGSNMRIINVIDPALVADFLATPDGEEAILNVISNNSDTVKGSLG
jgi:hypothetical protein